MTVNLEELNSNQREAVNWNHGSLLVLAGPGSGKTKVLTSRIARLIAESPDRYWNILGLTFTNKAAKEMQERVEGHVPNSGDRVNLTTFHSFASDLLSLHGSHIGLKPNFTIISDKADRLNLLKQAIGNVSGETNNETIEHVLPALDLHLEQLCLSEASTEFHYEANKEFTNIETVYREYRSIMIGNNLIDIESLIIEAIGLIRKIKGIRRQMYRAYRYICVDEFQDTNLSQYMLLSELVNRETNNLFVVADDDQVIYEWNGANPKRIMQLRKEFNMELISLPENYRCPTEVVKIANHLIKYNSKKIPEKKEIVPHKPSIHNRKAVNVLRFRNIEQEADWVARSISARSSTEKGKCVVLARTKKILDKILFAMNLHGLKGYSGTRKSEFASSPLQWLHSILRLANARSNSTALFKVCRTFFELTGIETNREEIVAIANARGGDFLREWSNAVLNSHISNGVQELVEGAVLPMLADRLNHEDFQTKAFEWLDQLSSNSLYVNDWYNEYAEEKETWKALINEISDHGASRSIALHHLLRELDLRSKAPKPNRGAIPCLTIHSSKGMEFDHVYLVGMVEDHFPSWLSLRRGEISAEIEEERRNCFVAITRTQESLYLTYSDEINNWRKEPSRFLTEMGVLKDSIRLPETRVDNARSTLKEIGDLNTETATKQKDYKQHPENFEFLAP